MKFSIKYIPLYIVTYILIALSGTHCYGETTPFERHILALYDSTEDADVDQTLIHTYAEVILNHMGLIVDYHDIAQKLPTDDQMSHYRGIISWFQDDNIPHAAEYVQWLAKQIKAGRKAIILGSLGAFYDKNGTQVELDELNKLFALFGVQMTYNETNNPFLIEIAYKDSSMVEFERPLDMEVSRYIQYTQIDPSINPYLILRRTDIPDSASAMIFTCKAGAMVMSPYVYYLHPETYKTHWRINPFRLFKEALFLETAPVPDTTTYYGKRLVFSHIDGDGFISLSLAEQNKLCGQVVIDEILSKYPFPISVSIVVGEILTAPEKLWIKDVQTEIIDPIRKMYLLPNIEPASHGYTHPLHWENQLTAILIPGYSEIVSAENMDAMEGTAYESLSMDMAVIDRTPEEMVKQEIISSLDYINTNLIPEGIAPAHTMFWTGNCVPQQQALKLCEENDILCINGGDPLFDEEYDSYTYLCPIKRFSENGWQFYTAACNENIYTNLWEGPYYGFKQVIETFKHTESPVRIKPANIYYHFYSGERYASIGALRTVYDYVIEKHYHPVFASTYLRMARDWFETDINILEPNHGYKISNNGYCRTVRIDDCTAHPDFGKCTGVIGYMHYQGSLYVHLDEFKQAQLWLTDRSSDDHVYLVSSTAELTELAMSKNSINFVMNGFGQCIVEFANLNPDSEYQVTLDTFSETILSDDHGSLKITFPSYTRIKNGHVRITAR